MSVQFARVMRNFNHRIEEPVRKHLRNVYGCLTMAAASAAVGAFVNVYTRMVSAGIFSVLAGIGLALALMFTPYNGKNNKLRLGYLLGFAFFSVEHLPNDIWQHFPVILLLDVSINFLIWLNVLADFFPQVPSRVGMGPLINYAIALNPSIIVTALLATVLIFSCFTLSVLFAPRGYWLFLAGPISTILSALFFLSLGNIFFQSTLLYQVNIYVGLFVICGYVIYDTTIIMEKCRMNDKDFISHSLDLFIDFIAIFKRLLIILAEREESQKSRSKNK